MTRRYRMHAPATKAAAVQAVADGASMTATAKAFGITISLLQAWCHAAGVRSQHAAFPVRGDRDSRRDRFTTQAQRQQALGAVEDGASFEEAGRMVGVSGTAVRYWWRARPGQAA
jgi:transposase-like protein